MESYVQYKPCLCVRRDPCLDRRWRNLAAIKEIPEWNLTPDDANLIPVAMDTNQTSTANSDQYSIDVELSDGQSQPRNVEPLPLATGEPLSPEEIGSILARLPDLPFVPGEETTFNLPQEVLPPPRPGLTNGAS